MPHDHDNQIQFVRNYMAERQHREEAEKIAEITRRDNLVKAAHDYAAMPRAQLHSSHWNEVLAVHAQLSSLAQQIYSSIRMELLGSLESCNKAHRILNESHRYVAAAETLPIPSPIALEWLDKKSLVSRSESFLKEMTEIDKLYDECLVKINNLDARFDPALLDSIKNIDNILENMRKKFVDVTYADNLLLNKIENINNVRIKLSSNVVTYVALTACGLSTKGYAYLEKDQEKICKIVENALHKISGISNIQTSEKLNKVTGIIASTLKPLYNSSYKDILSSTPKLRLNCKFDRKAEDDIIHTVCYEGSRHLR